MFLAVYWNLRPYSPLCLVTLWPYFLWYVGMLVSTFCAIQLPVFPPVPFSLLYSMKGIVFYAFQWLFLCFPWDLAVSAALCGHILLWIY